MRSVGESLHALGMNPRIRLAAMLSGVLMAAAAAQAQSIVAEDGSTWSPSTGPSRSVVTSTTASGVPTLNVAIVASASPNVSDPFFTDPQNRLVASGLFASVTVINAGVVTPTAMDLQAFDAVLVWSNFSFADADALGDRLADYVDDGGGVILTVFSNSSETIGRALGGRWALADYDIIPPASGTKTGAATLGTVHDGAHPIMAGVTTFDGGTSSFRPTTTSIIPSASLIAEWSDGSTLVTAREDTVGARADLGFYPPSNVVLGGFWDPATDGGVLMANALLYAAQRTPLSPGDSDDDGDVDADDFAAFDACVNIDPEVFAPAGCIVFDFDGNKRVDCDDWFLLRDVWTDPGVPPFPAVCHEIIPATSTWGLVVFALTMLVAGSLLRVRRSAQRICP